MIKVTVHLHTILQRQTAEGMIDEIQLSVPAHSEVGDLLEIAGVELGPDMLILVRNGRVVGPEEPLQAGDQINLMPAISGGAARRPDGQGRR